MFRAMWANWVLHLSFRGGRKSERKVSLSSMLWKAPNAASIRCADPDLPRSVHQGATCWGAPGSLFTSEIRSSIQCDCLLWACLPLLPSTFVSDFRCLSFQLASCFGKLAFSPLALRINFKCWYSPFPHWQPTGCYSVCAMENQPLKHVVVNHLRGLVCAGAGQCCEQLASALAANMLIQAYYAKPPRPAL